MKYCGLSYLFVALSLLGFTQCAPKNYQSKQETCFLQEDSLLMMSYMQESQNLVKKYAHNRDSLLLKNSELLKHTIQKAQDLAIKFSATPSGLNRCYQFRMDISKETLGDIIFNLPRNLTKTDVAQAIKKHIKTDQVETGMPFYPIDAIGANGKKIEWEDYKNKNILLIYGGMECMGTSGRNSLESLREGLSEDDLAIIIYYPVESLEELQTLSAQFSHKYTFISELKTLFSPFEIKYGVRETPTCFLIDREGIVALKSKGFNKNQIKKVIK